jgi:hypothetical protein
VTIAAENILIDEFERVTRKCLEMALAGDPTALKIIFDRLYPPRKGRPLPKLVKAKGEGTVNALLRMVLNGELTPEEGTQVVNLVEAAAKVAATQALGEMRAQQVEAFRQAQERGQIGAGIMIVPLAAVGEWESIAVEAQRELKGRIRD